MPMTLKCIFSVQTSLVKFSLISNGLLDISTLIDIANLTYSPSSLPPTSYFLHPFYVKNDNSIPTVA